MKTSENWRIKVFIIDWNDIFVGRVIWWISCKMGRPNAEWKIKWRTKSEEWKKIWVSTEWNAEKRMNESLYNQLLKTKYKEYT